ncbi:MAG: hypothetical protein ACYC4L_15260 [Chloroflexota bacterium]
MTWLDTLARLLSIPPSDAGADTTGQAAHSAAATPAREGLTLAQEDRLWRSVSNAGIVEPPWHFLQEQMLEATEAYRANPLAFRIVELTADHVLGRGVKLTSPDRDVQAWLDEWWRHPQNHMATRSYDLCRELAICGELFVTFHPSILDGMVFIRQLPPVNVDEITTDPDDLETELQFHDSGPGENPQGRWWSTRDCQHYAINRLAGCVRGQSDLGPALPWLRRYKEWLTDRVRINRFKGAFLWWVKLPGADRATVEQKRLELTRPPESGSVIVTNEAEEWTAVQPNIDAQSVEADGRAIRMMLAAGSGIPLHFLAEPEQTNRATAAEMQGPTLRHFENRQVVFGQILADIARHAAEVSGRFAGRELKIKALFEDLSTADNAKIATAATAMVNALTVARDRNWVTDAQAKAVLQTYIGVKQESEA